MTPDDLRARISDLSMWSRGDERAPHKPLLVLWALGRVQRGEERLARYDQVHGPLKELLVEFGPPRQSYHPQFPFWYLRNDGLWEVTGEAALQRQVAERPSNEPTQTMLRDAEARGGFTDDVWGTLKGEPGLVREAAITLLEAHFPHTVHDALLQAVGLDLLDTVMRRRRDPRFRGAVLDAYGWQCAVCGFDARLKHTPLALEAAHIKWHQAGGPDAVSNGMALCSLHHAVFDRGALGVTPEGEIRVSPLVNGGEATDAMLVGLDGRGVGRPRERGAYPEGAFLEWHQREVWRG